jgi:hypothetical protein
LRIIGNAAQARLDLAVTLTGRLPGTLAALADGVLDLAKVRIVAELTGPLTDPQAAAVEAQVLPRAGAKTGPALRQALRRAVLRIDPHGARARHEQRRRQRAVWLRPLEDGMAELGAQLPAADAEACWQRLDALARAQACRDGGTVDQRRADILVDLILGRGTHPAGATAGGPQVQVVVAATTLLGRDEQPAELAGYGPIDAATARELAATGSWRRLLTDPTSGTVLDVGRRAYRPPADLARHVRTRDAVCRFPGCRQSARRCHLDHTIPYPEGPTSATNLAAMCGHHHRLKHETDWTVEQHPGGLLIWTSPTHRTYPTHPEPPLEPDPNPPPPQPATERADEQDEPPPF